MHKEYGIDVELMNNNLYHWRVKFSNFKENTPIQNEVDKLYDYGSSTDIEFEMRFTTLSLFSYNFLYPKLTPESMKKIYESKIFEVELYNPLTYILFLKELKTLMEQYLVINTGKDGKTKFSIENVFK